jgi:serine/threonine protein kinase
MGGGASTSNVNFTTPGEAGIVAGLVTGFLDNAVEAQGKVVAKKYASPSTKPENDLFPLTPTDDMVLFDYELPPLHLSLRTSSGSPAGHFPFEKQLSGGGRTPHYPFEKQISGGSVGSGGASSSNTKLGPSRQNSNRSLTHSDSYGTRTLRSTKSLRSMALRSHSRQENVYIPPNQLIAASSFLHISRTRGPSPSGSVGSNISGTDSAQGKIGDGNTISSYNNLIASFEDKGSANNSIRITPKGSSHQLIEEGKDESNDNNNDVISNTCSPSVGSGVVPQIMPAFGPGKGLTLNIPTTSQTSDSTAATSNAAPVVIAPIPAKRPKPNLQIKVGSSANFSHAAISSSSSNIPDEADWIQVSDDEGDEDEKAHQRPSLSLLNPTAQQSYLLTKSGTIFVEGFAGGISKGGLNPAGGSASGLLPLQDRLVFLCRLGAGASGIVYKALDLRDMRLVALKMIPMFDRGKRRQMVRELSALFDMLRTRNCAVLTNEINNIIPSEIIDIENNLSDSNINNFEDEKDVTSKIVSNITTAQSMQQHPSDYIVDFYDAFSNIDEGDVALMMEYMDGGSLQDIVVEGGCDNEETLASISAQALVGLAFLHKCNQLHRDVKPGNFLISKRGFVKIADFGILRQMHVTDTGNNTIGLDKIIEGPQSPINGSGDSNLSPKHARNADTGDMPRAQTFVGTATYMAPERIDGREYGYPSDIWSFGLSLLTIALGKLPIDTQGGYWTILHSIRDADPPKVPNTFSTEFQDFINKCLQKDPNQRLTALELLQHPFLLNATVENDTDGDKERGISELQDILWALHQHLLKRKSDFVKKPPTPMDIPPTVGTLADTMISINTLSTKDIMMKLCKPQLYTTVAEENNQIGNISGQSDFLQTSCYTAAFNPN